MAIPSRRSVLLVWAREPVQAGERIGAGLTDRLDSIEILPPTEGAAGYPEPVEGVG